MTAPSTLERLHTLAELEVAAVGGIDGAVARQKHPDYATLYHDAKDGHQANIGQLRTLLGMRGGKATLGSGGVLGAALRVQTELLQAVSTEATLRTLRLAEERLQDAYEALLGEVGDDVPARRALTKGLHRVQNHWHLLTAHIARRSGDPDEAARLPHPLNEYFAGAEAHACLRCHLDRPGVAKVLERPDPYTYVCAACHDEVAASFPPDLREQMPRWPEAVREDRVVERALGRPSKLTARKRVIARLAGRMPEPVREEAPPLREPLPRLGGHHALSPVPVRRDLALEDATPAERAYTELLFDPSALRAHW